MFSNPTTANLDDFATFVYANGVSGAQLPFGTLSGVSIDTSGNLTATSSSGTVAVGMVLSASGLSGNIYLASFDSSTLTGTVNPPPQTAISDIATVNVWSAYLAWSFTQAMGTILDNPPGLTIMIWILAAYNLGMHFLIRIAQDVPRQTFFQDLRTTFKIGSFAAGVIANASDEGTSAALVVPEAFKRLSLGNIEHLKTPYGRQYLEFIQQYGPTIVGVS